MNWITKLKYNKLQSIELNWTKIFINEKGWANFPTKFLQNVFPKNRKSDSVITITSSKNSTYRIRLNREQIYFQSIDFCHMRASDRGSHPGSQLLRIDNWQIWHNNIFIINYKYKTRLEYFQLLRIDNWIIYIEKYL